MGTTQLGLRGRFSYICSLPDRALVCHDLGRGCRLKASRAILRTEFKALNAPMKVLYIAGEVSPFSETTAAAHLVRLIPNAIQESETGDYEVRIMMPRYGVVSERRNRLHEVIRLSGAEITVGEDQDILKVKVASIPGIRLQVYFMDSLLYFKRKGLHKDRKDGKVFEDNPARALFYAQATLSTAHKLGWSPDVIHATGWIAAFVPTLARAADGDALFTDTKCVYTPDTVDTKIVLSAKEAKTFGLPSDLAGKTLQQIGMETADAVAYADDFKGGPEGTSLIGEEEEIVARAMKLYNSLAEQRELAA